MCGCLISPWEPVRYVVGVLTSFVAEGVLFFEREREREAEGVLYWVL
jgi:hypothetical protein